MSNTTHQSVNKASTIGILMVLFGVIFLLKNFYIIPYDISYYIFNWKGFLILLGTIFLFNEKKQTTGIILIGLGGFFMLNGFLSDEFSWYWYDSRKIVGPLFVIALGIFIILRRGRQNGEGFKGFDSRSYNKENNNDQILSDTVMGRGDIIITSKNFQGGKITTLLGNSTYDLSGAELADGTNIIDISIILGNTKFIIPSGWNVRVEVTPVFSVFKDNRIMNHNTSNDSDKTLVIKGNILFGNGEVRTFV